MATSDKPLTSARVTGGGKPKTGGKAATLGMMSMAIMMVTTVLSLRGLASQAEYGYTSI